MRRTTLALAAACLLVATTAGAASLDLAASDLGGNGVDVSSPGPGQLAIDPDFTTAAPMTLAIVLDAEDGGSIAWNALVDNLTGEVWREFQIEVVGALLDVGTATANAGAVAWIAFRSDAAAVRFDPAEAAGLDLGAAFGSGEDWRVVGAEGGFLLRLRPVPVPEPGTLGGIGLGLAALAARRSGIVRARHA